ncbi:type 1 glutamine amidotransferase domain-containing protein [Halobacillus fulvus]|nr:type 1 glutamine amidotransferase domain-containing protein [Halobacillus fulvus]
MQKKMLMVVTNVDRMKKGHPTGLWLSEFVEPATEMKGAGFEIVAASPKGGRIPIDPASYENKLPRVWDGVMEPIHDTPRLADIDPTDFDGIFLCGGHGAMYDFPNNEDLSNLLRHFLTERKIIASVCHGAAGFVGVTDHNDQSLIQGKKLTGFTNEEESRMKMEDLIPFSLEDRLKTEEAEFESGEAMEDYVVVDEHFITGQNPRSSLRTAQMIIEKLKTAESV